MKRIDGISLFVEQCGVDRIAVVVRNRKVAHTIFVKAFEFGGEENFTMCKVVITITMTS